MKGDIAGDQPDFKGRVETFKAGFKAAKAEYRDAKAQFKATTKALVHAKFNKGPKGDKGAKGNFFKFDLVYFGEVKILQYLPTYSHL